MLVQCWPNVCAAGPSSNLHWFNASCLLGEAASLVLLNTAGGNYKPTPTQCLLNVGPASPVLASIHSVQVSTSCCWYLHAGSNGHDALNQSWATVGQPSVALAHIQRGAKQNTITQYWANVGSAS